MRKRIVLFILLGYFIVFGIVMVLFGVFWKQSESPQQPIAFSHELHVTQLNLECGFCHELANKSISAGVPSVEKCMSCHSNVATDKEEIQKLTKFWQDKEPVPWIKIHDLPDHAYFSHKRHIKAGIECADCHGQIQMMEKVRQVHSLKMGWCVDCHRLKKAPLDCWTCHK